MKTRNNVMILDTETVGTFGQPLVHDIGYVIIDRNFNVLKKQRFLVKDLHESAKWILKTSDFYNEYAKQYNKARKTETLAYWSEIATQMVKDMREYKVTTLAAYNLAFDYRAIKYTESVFNREKQNLIKAFDQKNKSLLCIWNLACETILSTPQYHQFAEENALVSAKGNIMTSAEACYRFITDNAGYIEEHTALADAVDETEILRYIITHVKGNKAMTYGLQYNAWQKAQ